MGVAIRHPKDPSRPRVIPSARFDPARHELWDEAPEAPRPGLPEDLPGRVALIGAGITTMAEIEALRDFDAVPGIGQVTEARLVAYLERARSYGETGSERPGSAASGAVTPTGPGRSGDSDAGP